MEPNEELGTLMQGIIALAYAADHAQSEQTRALLLKALDNAVYLFDVPRGQVIEVDFNTDASIN